MIKKHIGIIENARRRRSTRFLGVLTGGFNRLGIGDGERFQ
jgi:hypothetical protein